MVFEEEKEAANLGERTQDALAPKQVTSPGGDFVAVGNTTVGQVVADVIQGHLVPGILEPENWGLGNPA